MSGQMDARRNGAGGAQGRRTTSWGLRARPDVTDAGTLGLGPTGWIAEASKARRETVPLAATGSSSRRGLAPRVLCSPTVTRSGTFARRVSGDAGPCCTERQISQKGEERKRWGRGVRWDWRAGEPLSIACDASASTPVFALCPPIQRRRTGRARGIGDQQLGDARRDHDGAEGGCNPGGINVINPDLFSPEFDRENLVDSREILFSSRDQAHISHLVLHYVPVPGEGDCAVAVAHKGMCAAAGLGAQTNRGAGTLLALCRDSVCLISFAQRERRGGWERRRRVSG